MDKKLNILTKIERVKVPERVYSNLIQKIESKKNTFSLNFILKAAAISLLVISIDLYLIDKINYFNTSNEINYEIYSLSNGLYEK
tara:strand:- start:488 stop:742 length:255 start_codon:yes stop_codon:yes gene_type:complete